MQLRGGLLIEPWKAFKFYTNDARLQSVVLFEDMIYVCNIAHQSGATFAENSSKFTSAGSGGGGSGGPVGNRYAGEWDLSIGSVVVDQAVPSPIRSTSYVKMNDSSFQYTGDLIPITIVPNGLYFDAVVAEGISPVDSGVRSMMFKIPDVTGTDNVNGLMVCVQKNSIEPADILNLLIYGGSHPDVSALVFLIQFGSNYANISSFVVDAGVGSPNTLGLEQLDLPFGSTCYIDFDTVSGSSILTIQAGNQQLTFNSSAVLDVANFTADTFTTSYTILQTNSTLQVQNPESFIFDLGSTDDNRNPFLSVAELSVPPIGAVDGEVYLAINGTATYLNQSVIAGDYVEFADNLQKLIIVREAPTIAQIKQLANDQITAKVPTITNQLITAATQQPSGVLYINMLNGLINPNHPYNAAVIDIVDRWLNTNLRKFVSRPVINQIVTTDVNPIDVTTASTIEYFLVGTTGFYVADPYFYAAPNDVIFTEDNISWSRILYGSIPPLTKCYNNNSNVFLTFDPSNQIKPSNTWPQYSSPILPSAWKEVIEGPTAMLQGRSMIINGSSTNVQLSSKDDQVFDGTGWGTFHIDYDANVISGQIGDHNYGVNNVNYASGIIRLQCTSGTGTSNGGIAARISFGNGNTVNVNQSGGTNTPMKYVFDKEKMFTAVQNGTTVVIATLGTEGHILIGWTKIRDTVFFSCDIKHQQTNAEVTDFSPVVTLTNANLTSVTGYVDPLTPIRIPTYIEHVIFDGVTPPSANVTIFKAPYASNNSSLILHFKDAWANGVTLPDNSAVTPIAGSMYKLKRYTVNGNWYRVA